MAKGKDRNKKKNKTIETRMATEASMQNDPNGSYTGRPRDKDEIPVQDADDL